MKERGVYIPVELKIKHYTCDVIFIVTDFVPWFLVMSKTRGKKKSPVCENLGLLIRYSFGFNRMSLSLSLQVHLFSTVGSTFGGCWWSTFSLSLLKSWDRLFYTYMLELWITNTIYRVINLHRLDHFTILQNILDSIKRSDLCSGTHKPTKGDSTSYTWFYITTQGLMILNTEVLIITGTRSIQGYRVDILKTNLGVLKTETFKL